MGIRRLTKLSDVDKTSILEELKTFLSAQEEIVFALLFGSIVSPEIPDTYGDIDLAIYVKPDLMDVPSYVLESKIEVGAYRVLSALGLNFPPLEVLIINHAPYSFAVKLLKGNYIVLKENEEVMTNFIEHVSEKAVENSYLRRESLREVVES